jgi:molybdopterin converting factor small subunit
MEIRVRIPASLRELVAGARTVVVDVADAATVGSVLDALAVEHPALERRVRDELGRTRAHVNLFVGADNVRDLDGLTTAMAPGEELTIIPAISGG